MRIIQPFEQNGIRLEATIRPIHVDTHSKMQSLTEEQVEKIKHQLLIALSYCNMQLLQNNKQSND